LSVLIEHFAVATAALSAGRREAGVMAEAAAKYNQDPDFAAKSAVFGPILESGRALEPGLGPRVASIRG
jgi:hypothetical protein